jgi:hypothetical protein
MSKDSAQRTIPFHSISSANTNTVNLYSIYTQTGNYTKLKQALNVKLHQDPFSGFESETVRTDRRILPALQCYVLIANKAQKLETKNRSLVQEAQYAFSTVILHNCCKR